MHGLFLILFLVFLKGIHAVSSSGNRLLVVLEDSAEKEKYSQFWDDLEGRGYNILFESPKNEKLFLFQHGQRAYDHIILLPTRSKGLGPTLTPNNLIQFINENGNILLALSAAAPIPSAISSLLLELDVHLSPDRTSVMIDHFNYDTKSAEVNHDVLLLPRPAALRQDVQNFFGGSGLIAFPRVVAQELGSSNPLIAPIVRAPSTSYCYNPKEESEIVEEPFAVGSQISLVSSIQARNSARLTVLGSVEALENKWFNAKVQAPGGKEVGTVNRDFAKQVSTWTFMETGVLKVGKVGHHLSTLSETGSSNESIIQQESPGPNIYRIKTDVTFNIELSEYLIDRSIPPNFPNKDALQLEFTMLSPFHRLNLIPTLRTTNSTTFSTTFRLPDQHGIFAFRVNYKRPFLTNVDVKREVTVRHFAHDEWPRSWMISAGWVWIAGIWITVTGWIIFVGLWLWSEPAYELRHGKKLQ